MVLVIVAVVAAMIQKFRDVFRRSSLKWRLTQGVECWHLTLELLATRCALSREMGLADARLTVSVMLCSDICIEKGN